MFPELITNWSTSKIIPKNKFRFNERKKNRENGALKIRINASNKNYFDLYEKAFNDSLSEQKFSFRPKMNKRFHRTQIFDHCKPFLCDEFQEFPD